MKNNKPVIQMDTTNEQTYCRSRCGNAGCSRHISKGMKYTGWCQFALLKNTLDCEGFIPVRKNIGDVPDSGTKPRGSGAVQSGR